MVKIFILGRPGSGKTTAARYIAELSKNKDCSTIHINDYEILYEMFKADSECKKFRSTPHNGFDVCDFSVLDTALKEVEKRVQRYLSSVELITIEFARDDYYEALKQFSRNFLRDAYFLFIDADVDTCLKRIHRRVANKSTSDDHPSLSDDSFRIYYGKDNRSYMTSNFTRDYHINEAHVEIIDNIGLWESFIEKVNEFVKVIFKQDPSISLKDRALQGCPTAQEADIIRGISTLIPVGALII